MLIKSLIWLGVLLASRFIKISLLIGSASSISLLAVIAPLSASIFSGFNGVFAIAGLMSAHFLFPIIPLKLGLPTLAATISWALATNKSCSVWYKIANITCNILLPITCILLFIMHPVGSNAWAYAMYWLIPTGIACIRFYFEFLSNPSRRDLTIAPQDERLSVTARLEENPELVEGDVSKGYINTSFFSALQSTFVAHAVGSIIWLYTVPMAPEQWLSLIPLVAVERFTLTGLMVIGHKGIIFFANSIKRPQSTLNANFAKI